MIVKKTFSVRWVENFVRRFDGVVTLLSSRFVSHDNLSDAMDETYDYLFVIAKAAGVTPKKFAKILSEKDALRDYAGDVIKESIELANKPEKPNASKPKVKKVAKKKTAKK